MIRIGAVNIDTSHPLGFGEVMEKDDRARYVGVYNDSFRPDSEVEGFIRRFGSYPEGVCYSILIMNCTTWLLDKYIRPTIYGAPKKEKKEAAAK